MQLFNHTMKSLESALNATAARQNVISQNIANVDTPFYKAKEVVFKHELEKAISIEAKKTHQNHIEFKYNNKSDYVIKSKNNTVMNNNGNNVDIDKEMALLAENQILYNALIERLNGKFNAIKTVARGGK